MSRTDYYDNPDAPSANSLVVAVAVVVLDDDARVLMIERTENGKWALPGGAQELGKSVRDAAVRETREETGIDIELSGVVGIYSDPRHVIAYDDGEVGRSPRSACAARRWAGVPAWSTDTGPSLRPSWIRSSVVLPGGGVPGRGSNPHRPARSGPALDLRPGSKV